MNSPSDSYNMKYATHKMLLLLLGLGTLRGYVNGFNVINTVKQQVFSMMNIPTSHLTKPTSHFADGIYNPGPKCYSAILEADERYSKLSECFPQMPLFFSTLDDVCHPDCLQDTVSGAKLISKSCAPPKSPSNNQRVYNSWADEETAIMACEKEDSSYCLSKVIQAEITLENDSMMPNPMPREELKKMLCSPCTEKFYKSVKKPGQEPVLYYYQIMHPEKLFVAFEQYCGYQV